MLKNLAEILLVGLVVVIFFIMAVSTKMMDVLAQIEKDSKK